MRILFVEDDDNKRRRVSEYLTEILVDATIDNERSLQSAIRSMRNREYSLIMLDMSLPNYDPGPDEPGGKPQIFGGREFLRQMDRFDIDIPVIVITQYPAFGRGANSLELSDLDSELRDEHGTIYRGAIYYNAAIQDWMSTLKDLMMTVAPEMVKQ